MPRHQEGDVLKLVGIGLSVEPNLAARQQVDQFERNIVPNVKRVQELSQEGYAKGVFEFARYLQAQRTVVETNLSYLEALQSLWSAASDLAGLLQLEQMPAPK